MGQQQSPRSSDEVEHQGLLAEPANMTMSEDRTAAPRPGRWRYSLGIVFLLVTVLLWTTSSFLASTLFANNTYTKPFFVTYINASFFVVPLLPMLAKRAKDDPAQFSELANAAKSGLGRYSRVEQSERRSESSHIMKTDDQECNSSTSSLSLLETVKISFEFCFLWFLANYFNAACLEYTTVASSTILSSTSSIWTLLCGSVVGVEKFTLKKLMGVFASLVGIILISRADMSGENDEGRGSFPYKSPKEIAIGDTMAFISAIMYGIYAVLMKKRIGDEGRVNMPLFFGLVGFFNILTLWPGMLFLELSGIERFELPPSAHVVLIVVVNSTSSLISDFCWAYAMLLTSPLVVTVGLSLTIPLSLIGQMILNSQYASTRYWVGAAVVFLAFIFINQQESQEDQALNPTEEIQEGSQA